MFSHNIRFPGRRDTEILQNQTDDSAGCEARELLLDVCPLIRFTIDGVGRKMFRYLSGDDPRLSG